jgi:hypothetical protein
MSAGQGPTPGTACVRVACSPHLVQARTSTWSCSSAERISDFNARLEGDQIACLVYRQHRGCQLIFGERDQWETERPGWKAQCVENRLERHRVRRDRHQRLDHRQQSAVNLLGGFVLAVGVSVDHLLHRAAGDVRDHADDALAADRQERKRPAVVATPDREAVRPARTDQTDLVEVAASLFDSDDARQLRASQRRCSGHVDRGPALDVVHDRRADLGDGFEVLVHALLRRFVVVGHDGEQGVGPCLHRSLRELDRVVSVVAAGTGNHAFAGDGLLDRFDQLDLLVVGEGR